MTTTVEITALAHGGACIGSVTTGDPSVIGKKAFVRETIPGETVEVEIDKDKKSFVMARVKKILKAAPARIPPPCPLFGRCGGCDLQHMEIGRQREAKLEMVASMLARQGGIVPERGARLIGADLPSYNYRKRVALHLASDGRLGFHKAESNNVIDVEYCFLAGETLNSTLSKVRTISRELAPHFSGVIIDSDNDEVFIELRMQERKPGSTQKLPVDIRNRLLTFSENISVTSNSESVISFYRGRELDDLSSLYPAGHFSQVNSQANSVLRQAVINLVTSDDVSDLYGGAGNFSIPLAQAGKDVDLVELDRHLVSHARRLGQENGFLDKNLHIFQSRCEDFVLKHRLRSTVIADPPRAGAKDILQAFRPETTKRILYVSCNLPSLCRDLKALCSAGYKASETLVLDMFPQTHFAEILAVIDAA